MAPVDVPIPLLAGRAVDQIGIVVADLRQSLTTYERLWAPGPWRCYEYGPETVPYLTFRGQPARYSMRIAINESQPQLELIEPLDGPSIYHEWLDAHGEGVHHLAFAVPSLDEAIAQMAAAGYPLLQSGGGHGVDGDGGFAYFDTAAAVGTILEAVQPPRRRRMPDFVWPPA